MAKGQSGRRKLVPESHAAIDQWKYEIAAELGLFPGQSGSPAEPVEFSAELGSLSAGGKREQYWGHISSREAGAVGGTITARLVRMAEQMLM